MNTTTTELSAKLHEIVNKHPNTIQAHVAIEAILYGDTPELFFDDLSQFGCSYGIVTSLVHYDDTNKFYDQHYNEIKELIEEYEEATDTRLKPDTNFKNWLAWWSFERVAYKLTQDLNINYTRYGK